jgi:hypothetical protein
LRESLHQPSHRPAPNAATWRFRVQRAGMSVGAALTSFALLGVFTPVPMVAAEATYLGNAACAGCHQQANADWTDSHHDLAMQDATP